MSLSFLLCASATFAALLFFLSPLFFLIYCSGKHIPPTLYSMPAGWESAVQPPVKAEMHITHILALVNSAFWDLDKHAHA